MNQQRVTYERGYKEEKIGTLQLHMIEFVTFWELQQYCGWWISISSKQCSSIVLKVHLDVVKMSVSLKEEAGVKVGQILSDRFTFSTGRPRNVG